VTTRADRRMRPGTYAYIAAPPFDASIAMIFTKESNYTMLISVIMSVTLFVNIIEYTIHVCTSDGTSGGCTTLNGASQIEKGKRWRSESTCKFFEQE